MSKLLITKPKILSVDRKKQLRDAGYIVIEINNLSDIKVIDDFENLERDIVLFSALEALGYGNDGTCRMAFGNAIRKAILDKK